MHAHSADLRAEVADLPEAEREALTAALQRDWRGAGLSARDRALCAYAEKLTRAPAAMSAEDVEALRVEGLDDVAIHDAIQVISYFNYINRVADAVQVPLEPEMPPDPRAAGR
jgi:uncharacterized peroxidase-related enzyme